MRSTFSGDVSVFDYDVVIWDPAASFDTYRYSYQETYQGLPSLSDDLSVAMQAAVQRRRNEFADFLNSGHTLIVIACPPQRCYVATGTRDYSGTGRNRVTTRHVQPFDLLAALPVADPKFLVARGERIEVVGDGPLAALLRRHKDVLRYETVMKEPPGTSVARVAGTDRVVASIERSKAGGYLILLPNFELEAEEDSDEDEGEDDEGWIAEAPVIQEELLAAIEQLTGGAAATRPAWANTYATAEQRRLRSDVVVQQREVEAARQRLADLKQAAEEAELRDQLFLGSGRALELQVRAVLELLGGEVTEPEPGRDDWRVRFPEGSAVVEVKGVSKSAAEKHAAQLEKWVAGALEETGAAPKGILIVNTWREAPLVDRTRPDFPEQMLSYCQSRAHCLVSGLQLFVLRAELEANPDAAGSWRTKLLSTDGVLDGATNWQSIIERSESASD